MYNEGDIITDVDYGEGPLDDHFAELASQPGATFLSVFGDMINDDVRFGAELRCLSSKDGYTESDMQAAKVYEFGLQLDEYSKHPTAQGLKSEFTPEQVEGMVSSSRDFFSAYRYETGKNLREEPLSAHEKIRLEGREMKVMRGQARQLRDNGVSRVSEGFHSHIARAARAEGERHWSRVGRRQVSR